MNMKPIRGGSWYNYTEECRSAKRHCRSPGFATYGGGFRVAYNGDFEMDAKDVRGGSWYYDAEYCRSAERYYDSPGYANFNRGFRVAGPPAIQPEIIQLQPTGTLLKRVEPGKIGDIKIEQPFYLGIFPVTQLEWQIVMGENPSCFSMPHAEGWLDVGHKGDRPSGLPVENVS